MERNVIETPVGTLWQDKEKSLDFGVSASKALDHGTRRL